MTERSADLPYKTREVAMLTSRRMLSLLLAANLRAGCISCAVRRFKCSDPFPAHCPQPESILRLHACTHDARSDILRWDRISAKLDR